MNTSQAVKSMAALAQESRLEVFRLLAKCGAEGMPAGGIADQLELHANTLSFHLKELLSAGLIGKRRDGRRIIYSLKVDATRSLLGFLMQDCCQGRPEFCQPDYADAGCCVPPRRSNGKSKPAKSKSTTSVA